MPPPEHIELDVAEALELLAALEDAINRFERLLAREPVSPMDMLAPLASLQYQRNLVSRKLGFPETPGGNDAG